MAGGQRQSGGAQQDRTPELSFDDIDQVLRQGDRESGPSDIPAARVREAGMTGGETGRGDITADDAAPETLLEEDGGDAPPLHRPDTRAADTTLRHVPPEQIGGGSGKDEAELAQEQPVGQAAGRPARKPDRMQPRVRRTPQLGR